MTTVNITTTGWYNINTCESNLTIEDVINSYKNQGSDRLIIYPYAYYFIGPWPNDKTFTNDDWLTIDIYSTMLPNVSYWILIQEYKVGENVPEPQPEPQPEPEPVSADYTHYWNFSVNLSNISEIDDETGSGIEADLFNFNSITIDNGAALNGINQFIQVQSFEIPTTVSFEFLAEWKGLNYYSRIFDFGDGPGNKNILIANKANTNDLIVYIVDKNGAATNITLSNFIQLNTKYNLILTISPTQYKIYVNGVLYGTQNFAGIALDTRTYQYIGKSNWNDDNFNGNIYYAKMYYSELTPSYISALNELVPKPEQQTAQFITDESLDIDMSNF